MAERRRWPDGAETHRLTCIAAIRVARDLHHKARELHREIRKHVKTDPTFVLTLLTDSDLHLAELGEQLSDAERVLYMAKLGARDDL